MRDETPDAEAPKFPDLELAGVNGNWWLGLSAMHTLFAREHNSVDRPAEGSTIPLADGEWLFQKARLVVTALIAKIHTTEWTPSLMNSPEGRFAMRGNWWGVIGEHYWRGYGRLDDTEEVSGIPGSTDRPGCGALLDDRGVHGLLSHAPADARRLLASRTCR